MLYLYHEFHFFFIFHPPKISIATQDSFLRNIDQKYIDYDFIEQYDFPVNIFISK